MKKTDTIEIQFRKLENEIIAVFPYVIEGQNTVMSYAHIGQHSACVWNINSFSESVKLFEYQSLLNELKTIYNDVDIKVITRRNHKKYLNKYYEFLDRFRK